MKSILLKGYYKLLNIRNNIVRMYNKKLLLKNNKLEVYTTDETLDKIVNSNISVSRFGDGEFSLMNGESLMFQSYDENLSKRLRSILISSQINHIVCIPNVFNDNSIYTEKARNYWNKYLELNARKIFKLIDVDKKYYDTQVTRLYIDIEEKQKVKARFDKIKQLWMAKDIVIVEGEKSRLGIGNDLFDSAKSINRIICPSKDAFLIYEDILNEVKKQKKSKLILIALGPTATVLAYDLAIEGYQAIDIGHIDIEYEWFLQGVTEKCPVKNKYIGEIDGGTLVLNIEDKRYEDEIISNLI